MFKTLCGRIHSVQTAHTVCASTVFDVMNLKKRHRFPNADWREVRTWRHTNTQTNMAERLHYTPTYGSSPPQWALSTNSENASRVQWAPEENQTHNCTPLHTHTCTHTPYTHTNRERMNVFKAIEERFLWLILACSRHTPSHVDFTSSSSPPLTPPPVTKASVSVRIFYGYRKH